MRPRRGIIIPSFAVIPELKRHKVFVVHHGKAEERIIEVGTSNEDRIEINAGLSPGDTLITSRILPRCYNNISFPEGLAYDTYSNCCDTNFGICYLNNDAHAYLMNNKIASFS